MTCRDCAYWKQGELVDRGGTAVFKERKNKAPYLEHYCRGMTDRQIAEITDRSVTAVIHRDNIPADVKQEALRRIGEAREKLGLG